MATYKGASMRGVHMVNRKFMIPIVVTVGLAFGGSGPWVAWDPNESICVLQMQHQHQQYGTWCWVATVSPLLKRFGLSKSDQCQLYDLWHGTTSCNDMNACHADTPNCWFSNPANQRYGSPEDAAKKYEDTYGGVLGIINVTTREAPHYGGRNEPLSFEEIAEQICTKGEPFIWAAIVGEEDGNPIYHDFVVFGYKRARATREIFANDPNGLPYDPDGEILEQRSLDPYVYEYDWYADDTWTEDIMISLSEWQRLKRSWDGLWVKE